MGKKYRAGGFYWERDLYQSEAFLSLKKNSMKMLIALWDSRQREKPSEARTKKGNKRKPKFVNLDCLEVPYGSLEKVYKIPERRIPDAIDELLKKGFIHITYHGGSIKHDKSKYALVNDYLLWRPGSAPFLNDDPEAESITKQIFIEYLMFRKEQKDSQDRKAKRPENGVCVANRDLKELKALYNWSIRNDLTLNNPCKNIES